MAHIDSHAPDHDAAHDAQYAQPAQDSILAAQRRLRDRLLIVLAAVAGYADAVSYVTLGHVFIANMTGSTVLLGLNLAETNWLYALRAIIALLGFGLGVAVGAAIVDPVDHNAVWSCTVTRALWVEVGILTLFSALGIALGASLKNGPVYTLIALASCAMGIQSVAIRALGVADITTTYISGTWVGLFAGLSRYLRSETVSQDKGQRRVASLYPQERDARLLLAYIISALLCGLLVVSSGNIGPRLALIPIAPMLAVAAGIAARRFPSRPPQTTEAAAPDDIDQQ
ncbi:MAG TPA: YoaK family protein [Ktedonobacterales bacterium]|nr:YoaK family protein [Ktedonobacterales bacterium]